MGVDAQMLVRTRANLSKEQVLQLAGDLAEAFGANRFWIWDDYKNDDGSIGRHCLHITDVYEQDGDDITPDEGEQFIEVELGTRYYGEGYERGDIAFIKSVAEWLEVRIPDAIIFYGGDSSGICAEPFDKYARQKLWAHFCRVGHRPYHAGFSSIFSADSPVTCGFCKRPMVSYGGGGANVFYSCDSCGKRVVHNAHTKETVIVPDGQDYSTISQAMRNPKT